MEKIKFETEQVAQELLGQPALEILDLDEAQLAYVGGGSGEISPY